MYGKDIYSGIFLCFFQEQDKRKLCNFSNNKGKKYGIILQNIQFHIDYIYIYIYI